MNAWNIFRLVAVLCVTVVLTSQEQSPPSQILSRGELGRKIDHVLRWKAMWKGMESFNSSYIAGAYVDAKVITTPEEVAVFIGAVGVNVVLRKDHLSGQFHPSFWRYSAGEANDTAAKRYIAEELRAVEDKDCVPVSRGPAREAPQDVGVVVPTRRACRDRTGAVLFSEEDLSLELPSLRTAFAANTPPEEVNEVRIAATKALAYYMGRECPAASVIIPRFSPDDPVVYTFVDFGQTCGRGIFAATRNREGVWVAGKLFEDRPPNDLGRIIRQIQKDALASFRLPAND